jgi:hypothetical protein
MNIPRASIVKAAERIRAVRGSATQAERLGKCIEGQPGRQGCKKALCVRII